MRAGRLRHLVVVEERATTTNAYGENIGPWSVFATVWAAIEPVSGKETIAAGQNLDTRAVRIFLRYLPGLTAKMRINHDGVYYNIEAVMNRDERNKEIELLCTVGQTKGGELPSDFLLGLVEWWSFDEMSGNAVGQHSGFVLTQTGTIGSTAGVLGNSRTNNAGANSLTNNTDGALFGTNVSYAYAFWFNLTATSTASFVGANSGGNHIRTIGTFRPGDGNSIISLEVRGATINTAFDIADTGPGGWRFLVVGVDIPAGVIYASINGNTPAGPAHTDGCAGGTNFTVFNGPSGSLNGIIDELAVFNRRLTDAEITWLYNGGAGRIYSEL